MVPYLTEYSVSMKRSALTQDRIIDAAVGAMAERGVGSLTVAEVAGSCGVSSALVYYHFSTKEKLLRAAAGRLAGARARDRAKAFRSHGLSALDEHWRFIEEGVASRSEQAWHDVVVLSRNDRAVAVEIEKVREPEWRALVQRLPELFLELGSVPPAPVEEVAVAILAFADGVALGLAAGTPREALRSAYDAFWLALIAAGQSAARR